MTIMNFTSNKLPERMPRIVQIPNHTKNMSSSNMDLDGLKDPRFAGTGKKHSLTGGSAQHLGGQVRQLKVTRIRPIRER